MAVTLSLWKLSLIHIFMQRTGADVRVTVPGHTQRGGSPVPYDRVLSTRLGARAAQLIIQEEYGYMVGIINGELSLIHI